MQTIEEAMKAIREKGYEIGKPIGTEKDWPDMIVSEIVINSVQPVADSSATGGEIACVTVYARTASLLQNKRALRRAVHTEILGVSFVDLAKTPEEADDLLNKASEDDLISMGFFPEST